MCLDMPAFPQPPLPTPADEAALIARGRGGMALLDYFAAAALQGFVMAHVLANGPAWNADQIATNAYSVADAMVKERLRNAGGTR